MAEWPCGYRLRSGKWRTSVSSCARPLERVAPTRPGPCQTTRRRICVLPLFGPPNVDRLKARGDVPGLIKALEYQKLRRVRRDAAAALGQIGDAEAVQPLIAGLRDDNPSVRLACAEALGQIGDVGALDPLIALLKSPAVDIRKAAAESLGQIGDGGSLGPLKDALKDASWSVRRAAAGALGQIGDADAVEPLKVAYEDLDSNVRRAAGEALAALGWRPTGAKAEKA